MFKKIVSIHKDIETGTTFDDMLYRGEVIKATTCLDWDSKGYPVDEDRLEAIFSGINEVKQSLAIAINKKYSPNYYEDLYQKDGKGNWIFKTKAFSAFIIRKNIEWKTTDTGLPVLQQD